MPDSLMQMRRHTATPPQRLLIMEIPACLCCCFSSYPLVKVCTLGISSVTYFGVCSDALSPQGGCSCSIVRYFIFIRGLISSVSVCATPVARCQQRRAGLFCCVIVWPWVRQRVIFLIHLPLSGKYNYLFSFRAANHWTGSS